MSTELTVQQAQPVQGQPGSVVLMGSGETSPAAQKIFHRVFTEIADSGEPVRMAILETPAGFEPNSGYVAEQVARFVEKRLQNFAPAISIVPARRRDSSESSTEAQALAAQLYDANVVFMGPGSPTYAVRHLQGSLVWETVRACHRQGAAAIFSSAATLAVSRWTLPIYEIYKAGIDLHWQEGLNFFQDFGLSPILVSHWNNADGGAVLDTSRCYLGQARFSALLEMAPKEPANQIVVGIDESTALTMDPRRGVCLVVGVGRVTIVCGGQETVYTAGEQFPVTELGGFSLPAQAGGISPAVWADVQDGRRAAAAARTHVPVPDETVLKLLAARNQARADRDWQASDRLRDEIARLGWRVKDTTNGQRVEPS
jgi:cyanophycinase-like exopeptidase